MKSDVNRSFEERRPARRVAVDLEASYANVGMPPHRAQVGEISTSGLRLETDERLSLGSILDITLNLDPRNSHLRMLARVVRRLPGDNPPYEYGLKVDDNPAVTDKLRAAVLQISLKAPLRPNSRTARRA